MTQAQWHLAQTMARRERMLQQHLVRPGYATAATWLRIRRWSGPRAEAAFAGYHAAAGSRRRTQRGIGGI